MVKVGLVDDYRVDLEKLEAIVSRMQDVEIVFPPIQRRKPTGG